MAYFVWFLVDSDMKLATLLLQGKRMSSCPNHKRSPPRLLPPGRGSVLVVGMLFSSKIK